MDFKIIAKTKNGSDYEFFTGTDGEYYFQRNGRVMGKIIEIEEREIKLGRHMRILFQKDGSSEVRKIISSRLTEVYVKC